MYNTQVQKGEDKMEVTEFTNYKFKKMEKFHLDPKITSTECQMYFLPTKEKWENKLKLFKRFYITAGESFSNKLFTLNELIDNREEFNIDNLVFPDEIIAIGGEVCGYMMPYIESENLALILHNPSVESSVKIDLLRQVGKILKSVSNINANLKQFYLADVNENNFVVDRDNVVHAVDLDSCKIGNNLPFPSRYIHSIGNKPNLLTNKYKKNNQGVYIPDNNTEMACYNIMVLNTIASGRVDRLSIDEYYYYLEYLKAIGYDYEVIDYFSSVYSADLAKNPAEILDFIPEITPRSSLKVYEWSRRGVRS